MATEATIKKLVERISSNDDTRAFKSFFDLYYTRLLRLAQHYVESQQAAEEVVSDVFISIWNGRKKLATIERIEAYLFTCVKYKSISFIRDNKKSAFLRLDSIDMAIHAEFKNPEGDFIHGELREKVFQVINGLPPRCKLIFTLVKDDGLKYREVATLLDISIKAVEAQVSKAMITLRKEILPYLSLADFQRYLAQKRKEGL